MNVVAVNRNYFISGGPEKYLFSLEKKLHEWTFAPFSVRFSENKKTDFYKYFISPPFEETVARFEDSGKSLWNKLKYAGKTVYSFEAKSNLIRLIDDFKPDAAFFLNAVYFSQSIIDACKKRNLPIIWRLSDFNMICGNYLLFREGRICTECIDHGLGRVIRNRCGGYQHSLSAAMIRYTAMYLAKIRKVYDYVSYFVCPSSFTRGLMIDAGFSSEKVITIPTFITPPNNISFFPNLKQILFVGRLSPEKGFETLVRALDLLADENWQLVVAGGTESEYAQKLIRSIPERIRKRISFLGFVNQKEIKRLIGESQFMVVPSVWFENMPNVILEAMSSKRPVITSRLGSLAEMVLEDKTGLFFEVKNCEDLADKIKIMLEDPSKTKNMGEDAYDYVKTYHNPENHINELKKLFQNIIS